MKIGILTLPLHTNYGGILQAYALQTVLERMGHEVVVISRKPSRKSGCIGAIRTCILSPIKQWIKQNLIPVCLSNDKQYYTRRFVNKRIKCKSYYSFYDIKPKDFDVIIVGSDQIWRKRYVCDSFKMKIENSFLDFACSWDIKRISYAASFGVDDWEYSDEQTKNCKKLIQLFTAVSVREESGVDLCGKYLESSAVQVLDPTLLLDKADYINLFSKSKRVVYKHYIMSYVLDEDKRINEMTSLISDNLGLKVFKANVTGIDSNKQRGQIQPPIEDWLYGFYTTDFVITDSFHACVFSIIFNKPFIVVPNITRGISRFESLLTSFGQEHRMVKDISKFVLTKEIMQAPDCNLTEKKEFSMNFLKSHLG